MMHHEVDKFACEVFFRGNNLTGLYIYFFISIDTNISDTRNKRNL